MAGEMACIGESPKRATISERLLGQKKDLEERLANVNAAIESLQKNPGVLETLEQLSKVMYIG